MKEWPRLSESLTHERSPVVCQACGEVEQPLAAWQEHDANDKPEPIAVVLCAACSGKLIEPHPRLYRRLERNEPFPGTMTICLDCPARDGVRCKSPLSLANGGPGLPFPMPDSTAFVDGVRGGRRFGRVMRMWSKEVATCKGKTDGKGSEK
jgi:hypothetical protein